MNGLIDLNFTIFGGTGDLSYRKLLPAFYNLYVNKQLPEKTRLLIIGRRDYSNNDYRDIVEMWINKFSRVKFSKENFDEFKEIIHYYRMDFTNLSQYDGLNSYFNMNKINSNIFYYAVAPEFFTVISDGIISMDNTKNAKIIIEKPFGASLKEAKELNDKFEKCFDSNNIYRIDHYLGKEMIRGINTIRFTNPIFKETWNKNFIESVTISALELVGVETRGGYYDNAGALKDMVQNHLLQFLTIVAMEEESGDETIYDKQLEVLKNLRRVEDLDVNKCLLLAQYNGYKDEDKVSKDSNTETYALVKLFVDNQRWKDVPFIIETGKKMDKREMEVQIKYKSINQLESSILSIKIQPKEGVELKFNIKKPGDSEDIIQADMDFCQNCLDFNRINTPEAYERLINACIKSERNWFSKWEQIELSWNYIEKLKQSYNNTLYEYEVGSNGPKEKIEFLK